jgi:hypothetical protein
MQYLLVASAAVLACGLTVFPAMAQDRIWPLAGSSGAEAAALLEGRCPTLWQPAPYLTCINGQHVLTATFSAKDRLYYMQRLEPTTQTKSDYAAAVAAELGFTGEGAPCDRNGSPAICWTAPDSTQLFAAMDFDPGILATQVINPEIEAGDGPP